MREEVVEQLIAERNLWLYRAHFWMNVAMLGAVRNTIEGFERGPEEEIVAANARSYIFAGLTNGDFANDADTEIRQDEYDKLFDEPAQMPWSMLVEIAAEIEVDAEAVLRDFIGQTQENLKQAGQLMGIEIELPAPSLAGIPISLEMFREIANGRFGPEFEKHFADKYIAYVMHGMKPCQHPYDTLEQAIEGVAFDLQRGEITSITAIERNGEPAIDGEELSRRIGEISNAGLN